MHLFYTPDIVLTPSPEFIPTKEGGKAVEGPYTLNEEESKHCIRVLRLSIGDKITLIDGQGGWYEAEIMDDNPKHCSVNILQVKTAFNNRNHYLHIATAPTKNMDRLEWFIEKATEIGIDEISIIDCKNTERTVVKTERLNKVAISAIKQSLKAYLPKINAMIDIKKFIASVVPYTGQKFIAHCHISLSPDERTKAGQGVRPHLKDLYQKDRPAIILIGPEGDFTIDEVKMAVNNGFKEINLGNSRLRTETAALYACATVNIMNENALEKKHQ